MAEPADPPDPTRDASEQDTRTAHGAAGERERVGPYRILEQLGEGGMGEVYRAEQTHPIRRTVALKIIKRGMDTKEVIARFEAERQALALMDHPCIAKVFEAGSTPRGLPYFAMEYVRGIPITAYCDERRLPTRERLELFIQLCEGVQHAHQKAIIHRDLKPSNVLVTIQGDTPVPKIIDFGVAKATAQRLTERTLHTALGRMVGTPAYMSPEQAAMTAEDVDTRTDVYSLGVILYELLTGALPFEATQLQKAGFEGMLHVIRHQEAAKPSARLGTLAQEVSTESAKRRGTDLRTLRRLLRGDLDWVTMKALEKDRARRYGSPKELAADLGRHLRHEPVSAGPPSTAYRAAKFVRRHRLGVAVAATAVLLLVGFAVRERIQANRIAREAAAAERVSMFLVKLFEVSDPGEARGNSITAREILDRGAAQIERELADQPLIQARLMATMGSVYQKLGLNEQARPFLEQALTKRRELLGGDDPETLGSMNDLGVLCKDQGRYGEAEPLLSKVLETRRRTLGEDDAHTLGSMNNLANLYKNQGRYDDAERLYREALEARRLVLGENDPETLTSMNDLGVLCKDQGRYDEAEQLQSKVLETRRRVLGEDHPHTLSSVTGLAVLYQYLGRFSEAERLQREALETQRRVLGEGHPKTTLSMNNLAMLYQHQRRYDDAERLFRETLETQRRVLGEDHPDTALTMNNLAMLYQHQRRYDEARKLLERAIAITEARGKDQERYPIYIHSLGELFLATGDLGEAERQIRRALELYESRGGFRHVGLALYQLAGLAARQNRREQALGFLRRALERGWAGRSILKDSSLDSLRGAPEFEAIVSEVKARLGGA